MKVIRTQNYERLKLAQQIVDWDNLDAPPLNLEKDVEWFPQQGQEAEPQAQKIEPQNDIPRRWVNVSDIPQVDELGEDELKQTIPEEEFEQTQEPEGLPVFGSMFQALRWAKENKQVIRISYRCLSGTQIIRDVEPHGDFWAKTTSRRILVTFDETVGAIRGFIINNIGQYKLTGEKFNLKFNFSQTRKNYKSRIRYRKNRKNRGIM